jgi:hypothetical protein
MTQRAERDRILGGYWFVIARVGIGAGRSRSGVVKQA